TPCWGEGASCRCSRASSSKPMSPWPGGTLPGGDGTRATERLMPPGRAGSPVVFSGRPPEADVAMAGEPVAGVGRYEGHRTVDASGLILVPGFIDGHMHIESTKLPPDEFARAALPWGTTTVVLDPHEIANVFGLEGVRALLEASRGIPLDFFVMVSSCVPASPFESSGASVDADDIAR